MKTSGEKADLLMITFAIFCRFQLKLQSQQLPSNSFMDHTTCYTYKAVISRELSNAIWQNDREITNFDFLNYTITLLLLLRNKMVLCYKELLIKD